MTNTQLLAAAIPVLCGTVIPAVVELVTKSRAPHLLKAFVALVFSAIAGALSVVVFAPGESWSAYVLAIAAAFVTTIATHASGYTAGLQDKTAELGIGPSSSTPADPLAGK